MAKKINYNLRGGELDDGFLTIDPKIREQFNNLPDKVKKASLNHITL